MNNKEKYKKAVALHYDQKKSTAPIVKAKGQGYVASEILKRAKESGVPIQKDESLVELLAQLNINDRIPEDLYQVVAEVFAYIYKIDQKIKK